MALLTPRRFEVRCYDKNLRHLGVAVGRNSDAESASFTVEHNGVGTGSLTLAVDHKMVPDLIAPGARLQFRYIDHVGAAVEQMSGPVVASSLGQSAKGADVTFTCISDETILRRVLAWPVPANPITSQTSEYDTRTGMVDGICKDIVNANLLRLGLPVKVVPFFADGPDATIKARMQPLMDVIRPALEAANRGVKAYQWNPGDPVPFFLAGQLTEPCVLIEFYTCQDRPYVRWTPVLGITSGTSSTTAPTATRVVVGGDGEGAARNFEAFVETVRESDWGPLGVIETFVDARDTSVTGERSNRAIEGLIAAGQKASLEVETVDGDPWTVGVHYNRGDMVRIQPLGSVEPVVEKVRKITFSITGPDGPKVKPHIGDPSITSDPEQAIVRDLQDKASRIVALETRR